VTKAQQLKENLPPILWPQLLNEVLVGPTTLCGAAKSSRQRERERFRYLTIGFVSQDSETSGSSVVAHLRTTQTKTAK
jgi:hypothetical protein